MCVYDIIKDHFNYKFIEKKLFHEYEYESEYGSNAFELSTFNVYVVMDSSSPTNAYLSQILSPFMELQGVYL